MKPRLSSSASIFARKGNPWVSDKEGRKDFGRNLDTEEPELDQFTRARKAEPKKAFVDPVPEKPVADFHKRKANICRRMNATITRIDNSKLIRVSARKRGR